MKSRCITNAPLYFDKEHRNFLLVWRHTLLMPERKHDHPRVSVDILEDMPKPQSVVSSWVSLESDGEKTFRWRWYAERRDSHTRIEELSVCIPNFILKSHPFGSLKPLIFCRVYLYAPVPNKLRMSRPLQNRFDSIRTHVVFHLLKLGESFWHLNSCSVHVLTTSSSLRIPRTISTAIHTQSCYISFRSISSNSYRFYKLTLYYCNVNEHVLRYPDVFFFLFLQPWRRSYRDALCADFGESSFCA